MPLNADRTIIRAIVPMAIPPNATPEIILIALCDFLDTRYLLAMKKGRFIVTKVTIVMSYEL